MIAAYDAAFIDSTLTSLAAQVHPAAEVIVVDDASRDDTAMRARRFEDLLPLRVVRLTSNVGPGAAPAQVIPLVSTELCSIVDADDVVLPAHLDHLCRLWCRRGGAISPRALLWDGASIDADYHRSLGLRLPRHHQLQRLVAANFVFYATLFETDTYHRVGGMRALRYAETGTCGPA